MIITVGLSHRDAPIQVRERLALDREAIVALLHELVEAAAVREAACLSTCNRFEVYACAAGDSDAELNAAVASVLRALGRIAQRNGAELIPHLRTRTCGEAVRHLFRVAASLDSLVVGEPQILGQVKDAFELARSTGTMGRYLEHVQNRALHVAKRVRTETAIGAGQVSVSSIAVDLARQIFGELPGRTVVLLGAGEMAETAAKLLVKSGAAMVVLNRSPDRAKRLAQTFGGVARAWDDLAAMVVQADVIIASTSSRDFVVTRAMVASAMRARRGKSLFLIDIAVPRNVEPSVNDLDNVYVYDIDNLSQTVAESLSVRHAEAERAEALVEREAEAYGCWKDEQSLTGTIVALRQVVRATLAGEVERSLAGRLKHLSVDDKKALAMLVDGATNKLLHLPVTRLKAVAGDSRGEALAHALQHLFDLPAPESSPPTAVRRAVTRPLEGPSSDRGATVSALEEAATATEPLAPDLAVAPPLRKPVAR